jgi:Glycine-zipper domain
VIAAALLLGACATVPTGPSVMVLPGTGKNFDQFQVDDVTCRDWALQQVGVMTNKAGADNTVTGAVAGTAIGAALGAAIGAAAGNPALGAAAGAGAGLLGGTSVGAGNAHAAQGSVQHRYNAAYMQCMYAKGNQIPVPRGSQPPIGYQRPAQSALTTPPPPLVTAPDIPPPPPGVPPPPPPGAVTQ